MEIQHEETSSSSSSSSSSIKSENNKPRTFKLRKQFALNGESTITPTPEITLKGKFKEGFLNGEGQIIVTDYRKTGAMVGQFKNGFLFNGHMSREFCGDRHGIYEEEDRLLNLPIREGRVDFHEYAKIRDSEVYRENGEIEALRLILKKPKTRPVEPVESEEEPEESEEENENLEDS